MQRAARLVLYVARKERELCVRSTFSNGDDGRFDGQLRKACMTLDRSG